MGIPDEPFWAPDDLVETYRTAVGGRCSDTRARWQEALDSLDTDERAAWDAAWQGTGTKGWEDDLPVFEAGEKIATRQAMVKVLAASVPHFPGLVSGAADLTGNTGVKLPAECGQQTADNPGGRQVYYGIREHAMGAACVGMAMHGGVLPVSGTFFVFLDYMRPPVRLATVSRAKAVFVFSHDSVGVGEDGPTHQPVEHLATLRAIPGLHVIRPADANETAAAWRAAVDHDGPTVLVLTRQGVPVCTDGSAVERGAGIVRDDDQAAGARDRRHRQRGSHRRRGRRAAGGGRHRGAGGQPARAGTASPHRTTSTASRCCRLAYLCCPSRRARRSAGSATPTIRSASTASGSARPVTRCCADWGSTSSTWWSAPARSFDLQERSAPWRN